MKYCGVGVIVVNQENKFLLHLRDGNTERMTNQWCLVGGSVEADEDILRAGIREVKEETNLTLKEPKHLKDFSYNDSAIALIFGKVDTVEENLTVGERDDMRFFSREEFFSLVRSLEYSNPYLRELENYLGSSA